MYVTPAFSHTHAVLSKGHKHTLIMHPHRYSHLRKFAWAGSNATPPPLRFIHPLAPLELGPEDLPVGISLESRDCLSLYQALVANCGPDCKTRFADLEPNTFFKAHANSLLRQKDVIEYETALKQTVQSLSRSSDLEDRRLVKKVLDFLANGFVDTSTGINPRAEFFIHKEEVGSELASLLKVLDEQQDLVSRGCFKQSDPFVQRDDPISPHFFLHFRGIRWTNLPNICSSLYFQQKKITEQPAQSGRKIFKNGIGGSKRGQKSKNAIQARYPSERAVAATTTMAAGAMTRRGELTLSTMVVACSHLPESKIPTNLLQNSRMPHSSDTPDKS
jgi:hypothetical protein